MNIFNINHPWGWEVLFNCRFWIKNVNISTWTFETRPYILLLIAIAHITVFNTYIIIRIWINRICIWWIKDCDIFNCKLQYTGWIVQNDEFKKVTFELEPPLNSSIRLNESACGRVFCYKICSTRYSLDHL